MAEIGKAARRARVLDRLREIFAKSALASLAMAIPGIGVVEMKSVKTGLLHSDAYHTLDVIHEFPALYARRPSVVMSVRVDISINSAGGPVF